MIAFGVALILVIKADIDLAPKDGLNLKFLAGLEKIGRSKHIAMVGDSAGLHLIGLAALTKIFESNRPIKQTILGMTMEVNEI